MYFFEKFLKNMKEVYTMITLNEPNSIFVLKEKLKIQINPCYFEYVRNIQRSIQI